MTTSIANTNITDTFDFWRIRTNEIATAMRDIVVTVNSGNNVGDFTLDGTISANAVKVDTLSAFNSSAINVTSANLVISASSGLITQSPVDIQNVITFQTISNMKMNGANATHQFLAVNNATSSMELRAIKLKLDEITDVDTSNVAPGSRSNSSIVVWNTSSNNWTTGSLSLINTATITNLTSNVISATGSLLNLTSNTVISNTLWTFTNGRVGIGTNAPSTALHVNGAIVATGDVQGFFTSDKYFKKNIKPVEEGFGLSVLDKLDVKEFDWDQQRTQKSEFVLDKVGHDVGLIAQEVREVLPFFVQQRPDKRLAVDYIKLIPYLLAAIKDLQAEIKELRDSHDS